MNVALSIVLLFIAWFMGIFGIVVVASLNPIINFIWLGLILIFASVGIYGIIQEIRK